MTHFIAWCLLGILPPMMPLRVATPVRRPDRAEIAKKRAAAEARAAEAKRRALAAMRLLTATNEEQIAELQELIKPKREALERRGYKASPNELDRQLKQLLEKRTLKP